ncbi:MAG: LamG domain-containing protein [Thermoanaerobaculia bacterium]
MKPRKPRVLCPLLVVALLPAAALCQTYPEDLIAYWKFDEGSGTKAWDSSGGGHHGTLVNGPTWTLEKKGGAPSFDGIDDYVAIPDSVEFDFGDGDFTICAWFKTTVGLSEQYLIDFFRDGNFPHIEIYTGLPLHSVGSHLCGVDDVCTRLSDGTVDTGTWRHVAITLDNSTQNGYVLYVDPTACSRSTTPMGSLFS